MPDRDGYIPGVPCWVDTSQADPQAAAAFYGELFAWEVENAMPPESQGTYLIARLRGGDVAAIAGRREEIPDAPEWSTYVWVDSADEAAAKAWAAGGRVMMQPFDVPGAGRMSVLRDIEGAEFRVWQAEGHGGAGVVNEHGAVIDAAARFYGAVFGWEPLSAGPAGGMFRLPGYGDHLEAKEPGLRARLREAGAPAGFEDVVAGYAVLGPEQPEAEPGWSVTFSVDDADAAAERAVELGGTVLAAPVDGPWVRTTLIADPQGARFRATQFVPENRDVAAQPPQPALRAA